VRLRGRRGFRLGTKSTLFHGTFLMPKARRTPSPSGTLRSFGLLAVVAALIAPLSAAAQRPPLLPEPVIAALAAETSGEAAHLTVEGIALHHRTPSGSQSARGRQAWRK
jgi:hypothetical protein